VLSVPSITNVTIEPMQGPADQPFIIKARYMDPAGKVPDHVFVRVGERRYALHSAAGDADCRTPCTFVASVLLPARSALHPLQNLTIEADTEGTFVAESVPAPLVTAGDGAGAHVGGKSTPAAGLLMAALALLALVAWRRRRQ
jgi:hypothetical protein